MLKWTAYILAAAVALVAIVALAGMFVPKAHRASRIMRYDAPPPAVYTVITDVTKYPDWRSGVSAVEILGGGGGTRFREHGPHGPVTYRVEVEEPHARLITRIDDDSLPFGGTWTFALKAVEGGTELTITEDGEIYNPIFRVLSRVIFSPYDTIDTYQRDLQKRLRT